MKNKIKNSSNHRKEYFGHRQKISNKTESKPKKTRKTKLIWREGESKIYLCVQENDDVLDSKGV